MEALAAAIFAFCTANAKPLLIDADENKRVCWDYLINCSIDKDAKTSKKLLEQCQEKYKKDQL